MQTTTLEAAIRNKNHHPQSTNIHDSSAIHSRESITMLKNQSISQTPAFIEPNNQLSSNQILNSSSILEKVQHTPISRYKRIRIPASWHNHLLSTSSSLPSLPLLPHNRHDHTSKQTTSYQGRTRWLCSLHHFTGAFLHTSVELVLSQQGNIMDLSWGVAV